MTPKQEAALREYLQEAIVPLIEQVLVKKLGQAMSFAAEELIQPKPAQQQEPVAWYDAEKDCAYTLADCEGRAQDDLEPLYLAPPSKPWVGLTDEQISNLWCEVTNTDFVTADTHEFARAIEAKLREKNA